MRGRCVSAFLLPALTLAIAQAPAVTLSVVDLTPKFLRFYAAASRPGVNETERWRLWQKLYGFAAVPPTPEGNKMARSMLDQAWPRFASALPQIRKGVNAIQPPPARTLRQVAALLEASVPIRARLVVAVGDFEGNDFTAPGKDDIPSVAVEVEDPDTGLKLAHEFVHVVEAEQSGVSLSWTRSIAQTIFVEGLAMHATKTLQPGKPDAKYVGEMSPQWLARCTALRQRILSDVLPHLTNSDSETVMRYTMGTGGAGVEREAYYAGWLVVGDLLKTGWTFPRLSRVKESEMAPLVDASIRRLEAGPAHR